jgi:hypothetical protein
MEDQFQASADVAARKMFPDIKKETFLEVKNGVFLDVTPCGSSKNRRPRVRC